jgi:cobalt/nickel transport system permease protein
MHIPDGYLGPETYLPAYAVMTGFWALASARLRRALRLRQVPLLALGAAFTFVIMLFNLPIPGGTTGHAVGAVLVAIVLGPWAACIAVSLALILQALLFGDGGITAIGANCLNMAVVMPFVGWGVYRLVAGSSPAQSRRQWLGAALGGYAGLRPAARSTARSDYTSPFPPWRWSTFSSSAGWRPPRPAWWSPTCSEPRQSYCPMRSPRNCARAEAQW